MKNMQNLLPVFALAPDADRYNGDPASDVISMVDHANLNFLVMEGAGGTGTATLTVEACDDFVPTTQTAIPFKYRTAQTGDTFTAWAEATAAGITTVAGANKMIEIEVDNRDLPDGSPNARLQITEVVDSPVDAGVVAYLSGARYGGEAPGSALS